MCCIATNAHDFEVDGIYYNITSEEELMVSVTFQGSDRYLISDRYKGVVTIPNAVEYDNKTYRVTSIGEDAFLECET